MIRRVVRGQVKIEELHKPTDHTYNCPHYQTNYKSGLLERVPVLRLHKHVQVPARITAQHDSETTARVTGMVDSYSVASELFKE